MLGDRRFILRSVVVVDKADEESTRIEKLITPVYWCTPWGAFVSSILTIINQQKID